MDYCKTTDRLSSPTVLKHGYIDVKDEAWLLHWRCLYGVLLDAGHLMLYQEKPSSLWGPTAVFTLEGALVERKDDWFSLRECHGSTAFFRLDTIRRCDEWAIAVQYTINAKYIETLEIFDEADYCKKCLCHVEPLQSMRLEDFQTVSIVGEGGYGQVVLSRHVPTGRPYALKVIAKTSLVQHKHLQLLRQEKRLLTDMLHPFIMRLESCFTTPDSVVLVAEFLQGGDLRQRLLAMGAVPEDAAVFYSAEVVLALGHLHDLGILYRDLKLENVMVSLDGHVKIVDLGLCATNVFGDKVIEGVFGTRKYMAPEVLKRRPYGRAVDWWGLGVVIYELLVAKYPFKTVRDRRVVAPPSFVSDNAHSIISSLLSGDPKGRLGAGPEDCRDVMAHPFFRDVHWDKLMLKNVTPPFRPAVRSSTDTFYFDRELKNRSCRLEKQPVPHVRGISDFLNEC